MISCVHNVKVFKCKYVIPSDISKLRHFNKMVEYRFCRISEVKMFSIFPKDFVND